MVDKNIVFELYSGMFFFNLQIKAQTTNLQIQHR